MSKDNKYIIRRTISQERFEVLWKKRRNGEATLRDLTEMDEIINRDPSVRQFVLQEMESDKTTIDNTGRPNLMQQQPVNQHHGIADKIKAFFNHLFDSFSTTGVLPAANC
ncbi:hypothetical protein EWM62_02180 [Mucilaginibacter terrigena]|uniref:Uncharacterized protein n=1 Tax=Mucilaginibacter terrigena TaxID=2492395 RepID=A0A4Q5LS04_9SPHI|nr:hypothetical protein [Mucilaginibacter terrigena]RYU92265.1 hypothetical protein EWM62_02180 [Mucilaginibacter terrigena]